MNLVKPNIHDIIDLYLNYYIVVGLSASTGLRFDQLGNALIETAYAEFGSVIEKIAASKEAKSPSLTSGYLRHRVDEYRYAFTFLKLVVKEQAVGCD